MVRIVGSWSAASVEGTRTVVTEADASRVATIAPWTDGAG